MPQRRFESPRGLAVIAALAAGCSAYATPGARSYDPVVVRLGDQDVRLSAFEAELETLRKTGADIEAPEFRLSAFGRFVEDQALALEAARLGFPGGRDRAAVEAFLTQSVGHVGVSEDEARAYFERHPELRTAAPGMTLREILVGTLQDARDVARILSRDPNAFELLARTRSRSPHAEQGGLIGTFRPGELLPEIEREVAHVRERGVSGIVTTTFGFHIFRVEKRSAESERAFEDAQPEIESRLREAKTRLKVRRILAQILSRTQVHTDAITLVRRSAA
jgi:parvulin-like peptidyl-prolyl isomerase